MKEMLDIIEIIGVAAFSISGAHVAMEKRMDLFGTFILALVTAVGGGAIRDVVMNTGIPRFFSSYLTILMALGSAALTILIYSMKSVHSRRNKQIWGRVVILCDAIGLSVFAVDSGLRAINAGYNLAAVLFMATITGVGGGVLRDILAQRIPVILRREIYALAAIAGALFLWFTYPILGETLSMYLSLILILVVRLVSVWRNYHLPVVAAPGG